MLSLNQKRTILGIVIVLGVVGLVVGPLAYKIVREVDAEENGHLPSYIARDLVSKLASGDSVSGFASWEKDGQRAFSLGGESPLDAVGSLSVRRVYLNRDLVVHDGVLFLCASGVALRRPDNFPTLVGLVRDEEERYVVISAHKTGYLGEAEPFTYFFQPDDGEAFDAAYDVWFTALESSDEGASIVAEYDAYLAGLSA